MTNKEKKECPDCGGIADGSICPAFGVHDSSDPLTSLLQSAGKEFDELFWLHRIRRNTKRMKDIKDFWFFKLTEAFNKGKEMR